MDKVQLVMYLKEKIREERAALGKAQADSKAAAERVKRHGADLETYTQMLRIINREFAEPPARGGE